MSNYGQPPQDPNQPQNPYGQQPPPPPQQNPYGQNPQQPAYGQPAAYGQPGYGQSVVPSGNYAAWGSRVGASILDALIGLAVAAIPLIIGIVILSQGTVTEDANGFVTDTDINPLAFVFMGLGYILAFAFGIWNQIIKQGKTGQTIGKGILGIKLIGEATGQPLGAGTTFIRQLCHVADSVCAIGYLWPLWDAKSQTFADKIMSSVVVQAPK